MLLENKTWYKSFDETLNKGSVGENAFVEEFYKIDNCDWIADVRNIERMRKEDTDFIVFFNNYKDSFSAEIKTDYNFGKYFNHMQRFFIEDISSIKQNSDGWYRYCKAEIIAIYDAVNKKIYTFKFADLKEYIELFYQQDNKRVDYINIKYSGAGYVINIKLFMEYLDENNKYKLIIKKG